jgi:uncharacterized membrane protein
MKMIPETRQIIIICVGLIALTAIIGWGFGSIKTEDVLVVVIPVITGFFTLLKGEQ